ncbi:hypothetical protein HanHA300_Chr15g0550401 [Helianthus annuus]|nr:hypothetical protein HanHA300_Chr15g0550401 [Helianthus annuus]KAJ0471615.1 hypothetical protein HanHA89_Chr15g0598051 [Helianthus annuus]KAJ0647249.1 hypothetical protein HanLR1_Chr15g0559791 [Helianthus annuus]KAJ0651131.1 hypothetical protein HanOQP8_Chr15g0557691 [Helianthus annuus]
MIIHVYKKLFKFFNQVKIFFIFTFFPNDFNQTKLFNFCVFGLNLVKLLLLCYICW